MSRLQGRRMIAAILTPIAVLALLAFGLSLFARDESASGSGHEEKASRSASARAAESPAIPESAPTGVAIPNPQMAHSSGNTVPSWQFESSRVDYDPKDWTAKRARGEAVKATMSLGSSGRGVAIDVREPLARADLISEELSLKPFTRYRVSVEYVIEDGEPLALVSLFPKGRPNYVDLAFLPDVEPGSGATETQVELHTGRAKGPYRLTVSQTGVGRLRVNGIRMVEVGPFRGPNVPVLVIDLLSLEPSPDNLELWKNVYKLRDLYGFESISLLHPLTLKRKDVEELKPGLIVFSPTAVAIGTEPLGFFEKRRFDKGVREVLDYARAADVPVLGICAGHQMVAQSGGAFMARLRDDDTGEYLFELGPTDLDVKVDDPLFEGLPRKSVFRIIEAHLVLVHDGFTVPTVLASTRDFPTQIFKYEPEPGNRQPWYTFQGHPEKDWEEACPEGSVLFKNLLRIWGFTG